MTNNKQKQKDNIKSLSPSRKAVIRKRRIKNMLLIASAVLLVISLVLIIFICKISMSEPESKQEYVQNHTHNHTETSVQPSVQPTLNPEFKSLEGLWRYDENTQYEFDGNGVGRMYYGEGKFFAYAYAVESDFITLDFESDYVNDCKYKYAVTDEKLTLVGDEGTAIIGKVYELAKVKR